MCQQTLKQLCVGDSPEVASYLEGVVVGTALPCGEEVVAFDPVVEGEDVDQEAVQVVVECQAFWVETSQVAENQAVASFQEEAYLCRKKKKKNNFDILKFILGCEAWRNKRKEITLRLSNE